MLFRPPYMFMQNRAAMSGAGGSSPHNWPTSGLVARWKMDNANVSGATITETIAANDGASLGGVSSAAGPSPLSTLATARALDGISGTSIATASSPFNWNSGAFSIGMWVFIIDNTTGGNQGGSRTTFFSDDIAGDGTTNFIRVLNNTIVGSGAFGIGVSGAAIATAAYKIPNSTWTRIVGTFSAGGGAGTNILYVNGVAESTSSSAAGGSGETVCLLGSLNFATTAGVLNGRLSDIAIWNRALSAGEA